MQKNLLDNIKEAVENNGFLNIRDDVKNMNGVESVDFTFTPAAHYRIKSSEGTIIVVNKKYVDSPDVLAGDIAIGFEK